MLMLHGMFGFYRHSTPADGSAYSGDVHLSAAHIDPADPEFSLKIPGGDLSAVRTDNSTVTLNSYGMLDVEMTSADGQPLQLKPGKQAQLRFPVANIQRAGAPAAIPMWHFDEVKGIWKEEGSATLNGTGYEASVSHFSTWNVDVPAKMATVKGKVTDACANNAPVKGMMVYLGQTAAVTDDEGNYTARVVAGMGFELSIGGRFSDGRTISRNVPAISEGATATQDVSFACAPTLEGRITLCSAATQLSHIRLEKDNKVIAVVFSDAQNRFRVFAPQGQTVNLTAFGPDGAVASRTVVMPNSNTVTDLGQIELCAPQPVAATEFTVKQGTQETPFKLEGGRAQAVNSEATTDCSVSAGQTTLSLKFGGVATGVYQNCLVVLNLNGKTYISDKIQITVTKYGVMGELVEGTFSGELTISGGTEKVEIRNGKFIVRRILG